MKADKSWKIKLPVNRSVQAQDENLHLESHPEPALQQLEGALGWQSKGNLHSGGA